MNIFTTWFLEHRLPLCLREIFEFTGKKIWGLFGDDATEFRCSIKKKIIFDKKIRGNKFNSFPGIKPATIEFKLKRET